MSHKLFVENLEGRQLLSASTTPVLFDSAVALDRAHIHADLAAFKTDILTSGVKLNKDSHRIKRLTPTGDTSLDASFAQLKSDSKSLGSELKNDRLAESAAALQDEATIKLAILQIRKDKTNTDPNVELTDHANLKNDRIQLQTDLLAGLDARIATRTSFENTISADTQAIVTAGQNDTQATTRFTDAINKFAADRVTRINILTADLQTIATARQKLANDLTASQST